MMSQGHSQSLVFSGESGAGKTEAAKAVLMMLVEASHSAPGSDASITQSILEVCNVTVLRCCHMVNILADVSAA